MLTNFIYAKSKAMFEERIAEVPNDAIVFIEDTKEIWTHGTYFDCSSLDPNIIPNIQIAIDELRTKVENNNIAPDWNAQKGEAGYIENRTHYVTGTAETINVNGEWSITKTNIIVNDDSIIDISWNIDLMANHTEGSCRFTGTDESNSYSFDNDGFHIDFQNHGGLIDLDMWAFGGADPHYGTVTIGVDLKYKTLDEVYIPDTVVKTTPQTLSDTDKNQALANLGIDPVVWKYIMNPFVLQTGRIVPDELIASDGVSFKYPYAGMYNWAKGYAYDKDNFEYGNNTEGDFGSVHCFDGSICGAGNEIPPEGLPTSSSDIDNPEGPYGQFHDNWRDCFTTGVWLINKDTKQCYLAV